MRLIFKALICFTMASWITGIAVHPRAERLHEMRAELAAVHHR